MLTLLVTVSALEPSCYGEANEVVITELAVLLRLVPCIMLMIGFSPLTTAEMT